MLPGCGWALLAGARGGIMNIVPARLAAAVGALVLLGASVATAQGQLHQITWVHTAPSQVARFVVLIADVEGDVDGARQIDVGVPEAEQIGPNYLYSALVAFEPDEFLAVAAVGPGGQMSVPSSWSAMPPSRPGRPVLVDP